MNKKQIQKLVALITTTALFLGLLYLTRPADMPDTGEPEITVPESHPESFIAEQESDERAEASSTEGTLEGITEGDTEERDSLIPDMLAQIEHQNQIEEMLLAELNSGEYSFEEPLVVVDPYGLSPLTALVLFTSEEPLSISVHVPGKTKLADVDYTFDGYNTNHMIPVCGKAAIRKLHFELD